MELILGFFLLLVALVIAIKIFGFALWLLWTVLTGLAVGALARLAVPGEQDMSILSTALYGIAGAFIGRLIGGGIFHTGWLLTTALSVVAAALLIGATVATKRT